MIKNSYNKLIRPVDNNSDTLTVYLGLKLTQLIDVVSELGGRLPTCSRSVPAWIVVRGAKETRAAHLPLILAS